MPRVQNEKVDREMIVIPAADCRDCRFFAEDEDGNGYCDIYQESWEIPQEEIDGNPDGVKKPEFCLASHIEIFEAKP